MMKIGIDILSAKSLYHGMGIYIGNFVKRITAKAEKHNFTIYIKPGSFSFLQLSKKENVTYQTIKLSRFLRVLWEHVFLPISLKFHGIKVFWGPSNFLPPIKVCKYVVTIHDLSCFVLAKTYPFFRRKYYQYLISNAIQRADCIIAVSEATKADIMKFFKIPDNKIKVIYNGVDDIFKPIDDCNKFVSIKQKYDLPSEFIFSLGVLEPKKNIENLILAYIELKKSIDNLPRLVIGGSKKYGWKNSRVFNLTSINNLEKDIIFTDFIEYNDLPILYNLAKLFVFPSLYEGFGLPVIEAMSCGTPVITANSSSLPEVAGDAAVLINPYDVIDIANAIKDVLSNEGKQKQMIELGLKNAKRFNWDKSAQELVDVFEAVYQVR